YPQDCVENMRNEFEARRDLILKGLKRIGIAPPTPDGAFYVFPYVGEYGKGEEIAERFLKEANVAVTPGSGFGAAYGDYIRISYAASRERINEAINRIEAVLG
ncbi:MAG: aminotransferase class I/II-fold pyridoxal phosphate-dependent enzyme, partial [Methermicoccaceae archaeon]